MKRALIADDATLLTVFAVVLKKLGLAIDTASDANELLEKASRQSYAIMIIDWNLLGVNGCDAIRAIRLREQRAALKPSYIFATYTDNEVKKDMLSAGANEFFEKPFELDTLKSAFARACNELD